MANPLVAEREDSTKSFSGIQIAESVDDTKKAIESGDWAAGVMGAVGTGLDALSTALDPFGAILAAGVGWLMEHVGPVSDALDSLTGDPDEIKSHSETWKNIAAELEAVNTEMKDLVKADVANWMGEAADAYRARSEDTANLIAAAKSAADGAADGIGTAGEVVAAVRTLVRDIIAELVGHLVSWALQVICTLGIAMAWVVPQVVAEVAKVASKIADITTKLVRAMKSLTPLLKKLGDSFGDTKKALDKIKKNDGKNNGPASTNAASTKSQNADSSPSPKNDGPKGDGSNGSADRSLDGGAGTRGASTRAAGAGGRGGGSRGGKLKDHNPEPKQTSTPTGCRPGSGDPIDMTTGRMMLDAIDVELAGVLPLVLERNHFSGYRSGIHFGLSWASTIDQRLEVDGDRVDFAAEDGTLLIFPEPGRDTVQPIEGPQWRLSRDTADEYQLAQPDLGKVLHFGERSGDTRLLTAISDVTGNRIEFVHDAARVLTEIRHSAGHRIAVTTAAGLITELSLVGEHEQGNIVLVRFGYDDRGRLVEVVNSSGQALGYGYDDNGRVTEWQDRNGFRYEFRYDQLDRCVQGIGDGGYLSYLFTYDPENRTNRATDSLGRTTTYELNEDFQIVKVTDPLGGSIGYRWNRYDKLIEHTDQLGRTTRYAYDEDGLLTTETRPDGSVRKFQYDSERRQVAYVETDGAVWTFSYDEQGRLAVVNDPLEGTRRLSYGPRGFLSGVTDEEGRRTEIECDALGQPVTVVEPGGARTTYVYDRLGRLNSVTDPVGGTTRFAWTVEGLPWKRTEPDGTETRFRYDGEGNVREQVNAVGAVSRMDVGPFDLPVRQTAPDGSQVRFHYDTELRLLAVSNADGAQWSFDYDEAGRLVRERDLAGREVAYQWDAAGQLIERATGAGQRTVYSWDVLGRLVEKRAGDVVTTYTYDAADRLVRAVNPDTDLVLSYDPAGRLVSESCNGRGVSQELDRAGLRMSRRTTSGANSAWAYDIAGNPTGLRTAGREIRFGHDAAGRETWRTLGASTVSQDWDAGHQLVGQAINGAPSTSSGPAAVLQRRSYRYLPDRSLTGIDDLLSGRTDLRLDPMGRVTALHKPGEGERYSYDRVGNVVAAQWAAPGAHPTAGDREYEGTRLNRAGGVRYHYDEHGHLARRELPNGQTWIFEWNADDQIEQVALPDGRRMCYCYDALGRRVAKRLVGPDGSTAVQETVFVWDGTLLAEEITTAPGAPVHTTTWDWSPDEIVPLTQVERRWGPDGEMLGERFYGVVADHLGSPAELLDDQGRIVWHARRTLWGIGAQDEAGAPTTPLRFPGQYFDIETGLHYNLHRYYEPETGRYLSPDPIGLEGGLNPYAYVGNPADWIDPLGLAGCSKGKSGNQVLRNEVHNQRRDQGGRNARRRGQPQFHGNDNVPVKEVSNKRAAGLLEDLSSQRGEAGRRAKELLRQMENDNRGWQITAGIHKGGLGGQAGGADPRPHITMSVGGNGYHVHVKELKGKLAATDITPNPIR